MKITGETPRKWKTIWGDAFKKNPYQTGFFTEEMVEDRVWDKAHRYGISNQVQYKVTTEQLKKIAEIIGYQP